MKKKHWTLLIAVIAIPIGNRLFNHVNPWLGIAVILSAVIYLIYKLLKNEKDEKKD
ncbi:hypothetical protein [Bacteroides nordii]|uniref:hypothetical protein n=1 Tax=Bacteroides nordii TaxID=291645 RepID=UPI00203AA6D7|nr:hypothetical protein [Bacteroides nordii]GFZ38986.1 hypothetical protein BANORC5_10210 [Bacteroides nordii]